VTPGLHAGPGLVEREPNSTEAPRPASAGFGRYRDRPVLFKPTALAPGGATGVQSSSRLSQSLLGRVTKRAVLSIEGLLCAARATAFAVASALGVQEGAYMILGTFTESAPAPHWRCRCLRGRETCHSAYHRLSRGNSSKAAACGSAWPRLVTMMGAQRRLAPSSSQCQQSDSERGTYD
jgi:hypothetical protein